MKLLRTGQVFLGLGALMCLCFARPALAQETHLTMQSEPGDYIGQGQTYSYDASSGTFGVTTYDYTGDGGADYVTVSFNSPTWSQWWYLTFATNRLGTNLAPGYYPDAQRAPFASAGHPGLDVSGNGRGCNTLTGSFYINDLEVDSSSGQPVVTRLVASFVQYCEGGPYAFRGILYYNAAGPVQETLAPTTTLRQYTPYPGAQPRVALLAVDNEGGSGIRETRYSVDNAPEQVYTGPFSLTDGAHNLTFYSSDWAGNTEEAQTETVVIDTTPPTVSASFEGAQGNYGWYRGPVTVTLTADDGASGSGVAAIYYSLDWGAYQPYSSPFVISDEGYHTLRYYAVDRAGNASYTQWAQVAIDSTPPSVTVATAAQTLQTRPTYSVVVTVEGRISEGLSGLDESSPAYTVTDEYGTDQPSGAVRLYEDGTYSFTLVLPGASPSDRDGRHYTIRVTANDQAGNLGSGSSALIVPRR